MAGFNYAQNIIGLKKGDVHELEVEVANLSASVLSIAGDVDELELSVAEQPLNISSEFVLNSAEFSDLKGNCVAFYDKKTKRVWGNLYAYSEASTLSQTQAYFTISNAIYRPSSTKQFSGVIRTSSNITFYQCDIMSDGRILQKATSASTGILGYFEYYL